MYLVPRGNALGDSFSLTDGATLPGSYPLVLQANLALINKTIVIANLAHSGEGSGFTLNLITGRPVPIRPSLGLIWIGENDLNASNIGIVQGGASSTVIPLDAGKGLQFAAGGFCFVGAEPSHKIASISGDNLTLTTPLAGGAPSASTQVINDTQSNIVAIGQQMSGYQHLMVIGNQYCNWLTLGDTPTTQRGDFATLRALQAAAAATLGAIYVDLYGTMRLRILQGIDIQGSATWHVAQGDAHLNSYGQSIVGGIVQSSMPVGFFPDFI